MKLRRDRQNIQFRTLFVNNYGKYDNFLNFQRTKPCNSKLFLKELFMTGVYLGRILILYF